MPYESILALIDLDLHRLSQARALLSGFMEPAKGSRNKQEPPAGESPGFEAASSLVESQPVTVRVLPPRQSRKRGPTGPRARKQESALAAGALGGTVPAGPVVVSAGHVKQMQSTPQAANGGSGQSVAPEKLTPEMLAQRWLRPSAT